MRLAAGFSLNLLGKPSTDFPTGSKFKSEGHAEKKVDDKTHAL